MKQLHFLTLFICALLTCNMILATQVKSQTETIMDLMNSFLTDNQNEADPKKPAAKAPNKKSDPPKASSKETQPSKPFVDPLKIIDQNKLITEYEKLHVEASDWLGISSEEFKNRQRFPHVPLPDYSYSSIELDKDNFRVNGQFDQSKKGPNMPPGYQYFWFRLSDRNIYYSYTPDSLNVVGSLSLKKLIAVLTDDKDILCFKIQDEDNSKWKLCAQEASTKVKWVCKIKSVLGVDDASCREIKLDDAQPIIEDQKITEPVILVPLPSKNCNEKWDYAQKGKDWECDCIEGKTQSPINIKSKKAIRSPVKPVFNYEQISMSKNAEEKNNKYITYEENAIELKNINFGKVITLDGAVYKATEVKIHTPAEHQIDGRVYDMEVEIIHEGISKGHIAQYVVLSILYSKKAGVYNQFIDDMDFFNLPNPVMRSRKLSNSLYVPKLFYKSNDGELPLMKPFSFYTYEGSLSAPPCTERTIRYVCAEPVEIGNTPLTLLREALRIPDMIDKEGNLTVNTNTPENAREVQPLNGRYVYYYDFLRSEQPLPKQRTKPRHTGHFERIDKKMTKYFYVNNDKPSGLPRAFVVSENEAKGNI